MTDSKLPAMKNEIALDTLAAKIRTEHGAVRAAVETAAQHAIRQYHADSLINGL